MRAGGFNLDNTARAHGLTLNAYAFLCPPLLSLNQSLLMSHLGRYGKRAKKGSAANTLHAARAISAAIYLGKTGRHQALTLAREAAEVAQTLGLAGADGLNPESSAMRELAAAAIKGLQAADRE